MESPQSPHSSSLWVFALRYSRVLSSSPISALKSLGYYTSSTVLLFVGLRVISLDSNLLQCCSHFKPCNYMRTVVLSGFTFFPFSSLWGILYVPVPVPHIHLGARAFSHRSTLHSRNTVPGSCLVNEGKRLFKRLYQGS